MRGHRVQSGVVEYVYNSIMSHVAISTANELFVHVKTWTAAMSLVVQKQLTDRCELQISLLTLAKAVDYVLLTACSGAFSLYQQTEFSPLLQNSKCSNVLF